MKVWKEANKRVIGRCSLCFTKQDDSKKRVKSFVSQCHQQAPLKVNNRKTSEQPQDVLMRHFFLGMQSSPLAITWHGLKRNFHQLTRCSWTKALTQLGIIKEEARQTITSIKCNASLIGILDARHRGKTRHGRNPGGPSRSLSSKNYVGVAFSST